jgi:hypothetical protein
MVITCFENDVATITYDDELLLGRASAYGFLSSNEFREVIEAALKVIEEYKPLRWIGDNRKLRAIRQADQDWFAENVFPRLAVSSIRRNATIVSEDVFNKMAIEQLLERAGDLGDMVIKEFESEEDAIAWVSEPISMQKLG